MVNQPLLTRSMVPQLSPVTTPKWQTCWPTASGAMPSASSVRPPGRMLLIVTSEARLMVLVIGDDLVGADDGAVRGVVLGRGHDADEPAVAVGDRAAGAAVAG